MAEDPSSMQPHESRVQWGSVPVPDPTVLTTQQLSLSILGLRELLQARLDAMDKAVTLLQGTINTRPTVGEVAVQYDEKFFSIRQQIESVVEKLTVSEKYINAKLAEAEISRVSALDKAAASIQAGLDKAEKQLQLSLDRIQMEFRGTLSKQEERLTATFRDRDTTINEKVTHLQSLHDEKFDSIATQFTERDTRTDQTSKDSKVAVDAALQAAKEAVGEQNKSNALSISKSEAAFTKQIDQIGTLISTTAKNVDDKIDDLKQRIGSVEGMGKGADKIWGYVVGALGVGFAMATFFLHTHVG